jgi:putative ABC transport system permease protein
MERSAEYAAIRAVGWSERCLTRLVVSDGPGIGIVGAVAGACIGPATATA